MLNRSLLLSLLLLLSSYVAYVQYEAKKQAQSERDMLQQSFSEYKASNNAVKQLETNLIKVIKDGQSETNNLRHDVDTNLIELLVKVESIERDSATTVDTAERALRLAKSTQQDYYTLRNAISYNKAMIDGWQKYYCNIIAPKNGTIQLCNKYSQQVVP